MTPVADRSLAGTVDYQDTVASFRTDDLATLFGGTMEAGINACVECCDRHAASGAIALEWESHDGRRACYTFAQMQELSARFASMLVAQGVKPGDVVAGMLPRIPELMVTILGTWRAGAVYMPLFTAFGPKAVEHRLRTGSVRLVVTDQTNRPKLDATEHCPAIVVVGQSGDMTQVPNVLNFHAELGAQSGEFEPVLRKGHDLFMLLCTSGTTGLPKPVPVPLFAMLVFHTYMRDAMDLRPEDKYWNIADSGWAYGLYYAVTGPLLLGHATTFYDGPFSAETTYAIIGRHGITNLAGSPTASGYRIGPFDVESASIEHPTVIEAAVIGKPDRERTEVVKAFVVLGSGYEASDSLTEELRPHVKRRLSAHAYPREIEFREQLSKTASGKLQRGVLRASEIAKQNGESGKAR